MKKQTAVEWLHEIVKQREPGKFDWEQAKQMEQYQATDNKMIMDMIRKYPNDYDLGLEIRTIFNKQ